MNEFCTNSLQKVKDARMLMRIKLQIRRKDSREGKGSHICSPHSFIEMVKKCTELPCGFDMFAAGLRVLLSQKIGIENQKMSSESQLALAE